MSHDPVMPYTYPAITHLRMRILQAMDMAVNDGETWLPQAILSKRAGQTRVTQAFRGHMAQLQKEGLCVRFKYPTLAGGYTVAYQFGGAK